MSGTLGTSGGAVAASLQNIDWLQEKNRSKPIYLVVRGERLDLDADIGRIVEYYENKPPDKYLLRPSEEASGEEPECARDLRKNLYKLRPKDSKVQLASDLSWSEDPFNDRNWEFFFHTWIFTDCMIKGYEATRDAWFLNRLKWVVEDWWEDNFVPDPPSREFSWYDHTIPLRLKKLTEIWELVRRSKGLDEEFVKTALRFVYWHARILDEEESIRVYKHNHGLDQADYLFRASVVFPELEGASGWREHGLSRMREEIEFMMSSEGIQTENSPGYHIGHGASAFWRLEFVEHYTGRPLSPRIAELEGEALKFATVITQPDGFLPQIGDTAPDTRLRISLPKLKALEWYDRYEYAASGGKRGHPPRETRFIFPASGYYVYRDRWDPPGENRATQLIFKCGFLASGHRQDDDGNVLLYGLGEPWLTDGGLFGYVKDPRREYMRSPLAHNVSIPLGVQTIRDVDERFGRFSESWGMSTSDYESLNVVRCTSHMYRDIVYERVLEVVGERAFRISDRLLAREEAAMPLRATQFRIPQGKDIVISESEGEVLVKSQTGNEMIIRFDPRMIKAAELFSGESGDKISVDTIGWKSVSSVQTVRLRWTPTSPSEPRRFEISLDPGVD